MRKNKQDILEDETITVDLSEYDAIFKAMDRWHTQESALLKSCYGTAVENNNKLALENNRLMSELTILKQKNADLFDAGQKLHGLISNIKHETDYLPDFYYEWAGKVLNEIDEILSDDEQT